MNSKRQEHKSFDLPRKPNRGRDFYVASSSKKCTKHKAKKNAVNWKEKYSLSYRDQLKKMKNRASGTVEDMFAVSFRLTSGKSRHGGDQLLERQNPRFKDGRTSHAGPRNQKRRHGQSTFNRRTEKPSPQSKYS